MSVQVVKAVQTFEVTRYFILLSVVQGACSRIELYVSKCVDQEEFCDGRTWMTCHVDPYCHTTYPRSHGCCSSGSVEKERPWERVWTQRCLGCVPFNQVKSGFITKPILVCNQTIHVRRWIVQIGNQLFDLDLITWSLCFQKKSFPGALSLWLDRRMDLFQPTPKLDWLKGALL